MKSEKLIYFALAGTFLFGTVSCQNDDVPQASNQEEFQVGMSPLAKILANAIETHEDGTEGDAFIVYDAEADEFTVLSAEEYAFGTAFAAHVSKGVYSSAPPKGEGWVFAGKGKKGMAALKFAMMVSKQIEKDRDFEIHVEYHEDGTYSVWYRYV